MAIKLYELVGKDETRPFSPHCWKARMCLAQKGLEFDAVPIRFTEVAGIENGGDRRVPVIRHGDKIVQDSFTIAVYLRDTYPDKGERLFRGEGAMGLTRFVESWTQSQIHAWIGKWALMDIYNMLDEEDQAYFRKTREAVYKMPLEDVVVDRESRRDDLKSILTPIRLTLKHQPFLGGDKPIFADFIPFGALQWLRICSGISMLEASDPVMVWFERMLDMYDGMGRKVPEATG